MQQDLQALWDEVEDGRARFCAAVNSMSLEQRSSPAKGHTWTPVQIAEHLWIVERLYRDYISEVKPGSLEGKRATRSLLLRVILYGQRKALKVPTMQAMEPGNMPWERLNEEWDSTRAALASSLDQRPDADMPWLKHPLFGILSARQVLTLIAAHQAYHLPQVGATTPPRSPQAW